MDYSIEDKILSFIDDTKNVPLDVENIVKMSFIDTLGVLVASNKFDQVKKFTKICHSYGGEEESTIFGHERKVPDIIAALANGTAAHSFDFDDTHLGSAMHLGCVGVPVALAVGEKTSAQGKEVIDALALAYEVAIKIGLVAPKQLHIRGFHTTSVLGVFLSAIVAGRLLKLSKEQLSAALGIAASFSSGIFQSVDEGEWVKPMHSGWAAHAGVFAAKMAKNGFEGPHYFLSGKWGIFNTFLNNIKLNQSAISNIGEQWDVLNLAFKPYPSCHATHSAIDAALLLRSKGVTPSSIEHVKFFTNEHMYYLVLDPIINKTHPKTDYEAKFSIPYTFSVALLNGSVKVDDFNSEKIASKDVLNLTSRVEGVLDHDLDKYYTEEQNPIKLEVSLKDGSSQHLEIIDHKGTPRNPMTMEDIKEKFRLNTEPITGKDISEKILHLSSNIEDVNIADLVRLVNVGIIKRKHELAT